MPPKPKPQAPSKKAEQKKKEKVIEDKTFGLKNKKGAKQQKFIQQVEKQVKQGGIAPRKVQDENLKKLEKEKKEQERKEMSILFKPVVTQKVEKGTDPKSVLCVFFKQGQCVKGDKCKFSHDLSIERKAEKRSLYVDMRDDDENMETWDEQKLQDVIGKKHGESNSTKNATDIICKYFLDAVEKSKYGWFWECPNGEKCIYRHALPPGFVLKKDKKKEDKKDEITIEELVERERAALSTQNLTKVTLESMMTWKKRKLKEKREALAKEEEKKRSDLKAGRHVGLSGREMFFFNPELANNDQMEDGDEAFDSYQREDEDDEDIVYRELQLDVLSAEAQEADGTSGTQAPNDRLASIAASQEDKTSPSEASGSGVNGTEEAVPINENLFLDDDLDDLDDLDEELDDLSIDH